MRRPSSAASHCHHKQNARSHVTVTTAAALSWRERSTERITCIVRALFARLPFGARSWDQRTDRCSFLSHRDESGLVSRGYRLGRRREGGLRWRTRSLGPRTDSRIERVANIGGVGAIAVAIGEAAMLDRISPPRLWVQSAILMYWSRAARCRLTAEGIEVVYT